MKRRKKEKHHAQGTSAQAPMRCDGSASVDRFIIAAYFLFVKPYLHIYFDKIAFKSVNPVILQLICILHVLLCAFSRHFLLPCLTFFLTAYYNSN